jgi:hypothetical protein
MSGQLGGAAGAIGNLGNFKSLFSFGENNGQIDKSETTVNVPKDYKGPINISGAEFGDRIAMPMLRKRLAIRRRARVLQVAVAVATSLACSAAARPRRPCDAKALVDARGGFGRPQSAHSAGVVALAPA